jgi:hypothetical protein
MRSRNAIADGMRAQIKAGAHATSFFCYYRLIVRIVTRVNESFYAAAAGDYVFWLLIVPLKGS